MKLTPLSQASAKPLCFSRGIGLGRLRLSEKLRTFHRFTKREGHCEAERECGKCPTSNTQHPTSNWFAGLEPWDIRCSRADFQYSQTQRAFTLIELVIVITLIGIAAAVIIPEMKGGYQDAVLRSTSRELVNVFNIASSRAVSLNQLHRVRIETGTGRYVIERRTRETTQGDEYKPLDDVSEAEGTLDKRISVRVHNIDQSQSAAAAADNGQTRADIDSISFYSDGTADSAELLLRDKQGYRMALRINPITAHVKILELERE